MCFEMNIIVFFLAKWREQEEKQTSSIKGTNGSRGSQKSCFRATKQLQNARSRRLESRIYHQTPSPLSRHTHTQFEFGIWFSLIAGEEEICGKAQRSSQCKNGRSPSQPVRSHQPPATRAPGPRTNPHGNLRTPGYLPGVPRHSEPRIYRVPSLQRHWAERKTLSERLHFASRESVICFDDIRLYCDIHVFLNMFFWVILNSSWFFVHIKR